MGLDIRVIAIGRRTPGWVAAAWEEYATRLPRQVSLQLVEVAPETRSGVPVGQILTAEAQRLRSACRDGSFRVALDERGKLLSSRQLAEWLGQRGELQEPVDLLIGGADGLDPRLRSESGLLWSLSPLTFPHALVRVLLAEQLYRAWTILQGHPYHRD